MAQNRAAQITQHFKEPKLTHPIPHVTEPLTAPRLKGKVAIITGCNSKMGIGRAAAINFAAGQAHAIYICDIMDNNLRATAEELSRLYPGTKVHYRKFDASDEAAVKAVTEEAISDYGRLDIFFANAARGGNRRNLSDIEAQYYMDTMRIDSLSVFLAIKHASEAMKRTSSSKPKSAGSIVCTASVAGLRSGAGAIDYSAAKASVINLVQSCAWNLSGTGIRVNAVCPGLIETGMTTSTFDAARARGTAYKIGQLNPLRRYGIADEIARMVTFLASDEASYANAQAFIVDGGLSGSSPVVPGKMG